MLAMTFPADVVDLNFLSPWTIHCFFCFWHKVVDGSLTKVTNRRRESVGSLLNRLGGSFYDQHSENAEAFVFRMPFAPFLRISLSLGHRTRLHRPLAQYDILHFLHSFTYVYVRQVTLNSWCGRRWVPVNFYKLGTISIGVNPSQTWNITTARCYFIHINEMN